MLSIQSTTLLSHVENPHTDSKYPSLWDAIRNIDVEHVSVYTHHNSPYNYGIWFRENQTAVMVLQYRSSDRDWTRVHHSRFYIDGKKLIFVSEGGNFLFTLDQIFESVDMEVKYL